ncbi:ATP synthase F1 subunit gamma [Candidatus Tisiphia endosymbiont of Ceraclea dissimilis]|uniref:ATP synthase F1 subunit gamma n=1 Tax=Candidatus Tisiphia endosymbiont of Ceraclea dissimilis TaxID=3077928 RepID=UPI003CCB697C
MSGLKQLRSRIKSVKSTQKITKAMQIVSATKFTKAKSQIKDSEDYIEILRNTMSNVASRNNLQNMTEEEKKFFSSDVNINKPHLLVVVTSERGLCGSFNFAVFKQVKFDIANLENAGKQVRLIIIGKKGYDLFKWQYSHYIDNYYDFPKYHNNNLPFQIKDKITEMVDSGKISSCQIYFNKCKNAITQIATKQQILPIEQQLSSSEQYSSEQYLSYEYEGEGLVLNMINLYVTAQINYALLQSRVSEEGARMTAMDNATKNADELINKLTLTLNRSRQDIITRDLIEIIAGAEAI